MMNHLAAIQADRYRHLYKDYAENSPYLSRYTHKCRSFTSGRAKPALLDGAIERFAKKVFNQRISACHGMAPLRR
jgi:hypothetical protein